MLPDYPETRKLIHKHLRKRMDDSPGASIRRLLPSHLRLFEGHGTKVIREDGTVDASPFKQVEHEIRIEPEEADQLTLADVLRITDEAGENIARQEFNIFRAVLERITSETGNVENAEGPLTPEKYFTMLERMELSCDERGEPEMPTVMGGRDAVKAWTRVMGEIAESPMLQERLNNILTAKRMAWRDRESSRKLVG